MPQPQTVHYVPFNAAQAVCGWFVHSYQYRGNALLHTRDVTEATCPKCIEAAAGEVEDVLEEDEGPLQARNRALDSMAGNMGVTRLPGELDWELRARIKRSMGV